jgi:hypothetical protein
MLAGLTAGEQTDLHCLLAKLLAALTLRSWCWAWRME